MTFLHGSEKHGDVSGRVGAEDEVIDPWDATQGEDLFENGVGVGRGGHGDAELVHCGVSEMTSGVAVMGEGSGSEGKRRRAGAVQRLDCRQR